MIDPYGQPPGHISNPVQPVTIPGTTITLCACDDCHEVRQRWTDRQTPLAELLDSRDDSDG